MSCVNPVNLYSVTAKTECSRLKIPVFTWRLCRKERGMTATFVSWYSPMNLTKVTNTGWFYSSQKLPGKEWKAMLVWKTRNSDCELFSENILWSWFGKWDLASGSIRGQGEHSLIFKEKILLRTWGKASSRSQAVVLTQPIDKAYWVLIYASTFEEFFMESFTTTWKTQSTWIYNKDGANGM